MGRGVGTQTDEAQQLLTSRSDGAAESAARSKRKMPEVDYKLYPSKFGFLWDDCRRCYWLDVRQRFRRPYRAMPKVFTDIDHGMKDYFVGKRTEQVCPEMPAGEFISGEVFVCSRRKRRRDTSFVLCGKPDAIVRFDDGSYGIIDFKTSGLSAEHLPKYARQLETYARAVENPAPNYPAFGPVSHTGLLVFRPGLMSEDEGEGGIALRGKIEWVEVARGEAHLDSFLRRVIDLLRSDEMPDADPDCPYCAYRQSVADSGAAAAA